MKFKEALTTLPQYILPHHTLSQLMSKLTHCENATIKNLFIREIIKYYHVNMAEAAETNIEAFRSFNHFFTRALKSGIRPIDSNPKAIVSPADGVVSQAGQIVDGTIFQAKGKSFSTLTLLGGDAQRAAPFNEGLFTTIYLSPKDYHRLHMPFDGTLREMIHIPGRLFSVNTATTNSVPGLFARNERVVCIFDTAIGPMALILVGAIFVSSIETTWHGVVTPPSIIAPQVWHYDNKAPTLAKGEEMGRFNMGSTIIVLFGKEAMQWQADYQAEKSVKLGEQIGTTI